MGRINKRLNGPALITSSAVTKYTVPAATRTIIRHIHIQNPSASPVDLTISIGTDAAAVRILDGFPIPADSERSFYGPYTLEATEIVQALAGTTNILSMVIDGEENTL